MSRIDIVGLGPGNPGQMTLETLKLLKNSNQNFFRTDVHPVMDFIREEGISYESFDCFYENEDSFEDVYENIVEKIMLIVKNGRDIVYAVPGNPLFGEKTVVKLIESAKIEGVDYQIYPGVSFVDVTMNALEEDPIKGIKIMDAFDFKRFSPDPQMGVLVTQVYDKHMASELKLELMEIYDPEKKVILLINSGIPGKEIKKEICLYELDRSEEINHLTSLYIPAEKEAYLGFKGTLAIMKTLRSDEGCSWDRIQTHESLKTDLLEESYEVVDAIDNEDWENLAEELGDVLFQIVFHAEIGCENNRFTMTDVINGINEKMIRRHPHVFLNKFDFDPQKVETNWDAIKRLEKGGDQPREEADSVHQISYEMRKLPKALPALMEAFKVQKKAAKVGFDWDDALPALDKISEEAGELVAALKANDQQNIEEELGDLLFSVVNVARLVKIQPEIVLRKATQKFINRFEAMEKIANQEKKSLNDYNLDQLDGIWDQAKRQ
ncbi:nucleoside triphosphate pyrophosphohydrolase [Acetobacterium bakii]|uniref:Nucleotide pyrophosphohydrolase n=1 Tax=Acetobacterium bakii TaxID=52689 RepID=A0A0L6U3W8_9FIRM|nr:nucleoside triphosphate pyrophosphohydrolase [Acetobacterium bakii]KNZ43213.1 nucleotide pyrophosphohydrolase [Acetobacterium bakii]